MIEAHDAAADVDDRIATETDDLQLRKGCRPFRRLGCSVMLVIWFTLLLAPCALFYLAANREIRLWHRQVPEPHAHPLLLLSLVSETEDRGLRIERSFVATGSHSTTATCVETNVRFLLWQSQSGNQDVNYCDCYERDGEENAWMLESTYSGHCSADH